MNYVIIGGCGYIGRMLAQRLSRKSTTGKIFILDIKVPDFELGQNIEYVHWDVRRDFVDFDKLKAIDWIFNFAAIHREPGHEFSEYFDTNLPGATNVCHLAEAIECHNIFFTSSIAVYGPTNHPTSEETSKYPFTGYGISKLIAEKNHEIWQSSDPRRRLVICRPGVVYGPHEPGNIQRLIKAVRKGIFIFPGRKDVHKSYAYIEGLLDSMEFTSERKDPLIHYNYVENPTEPLYRLCEHIRDVFGVRGFSFSVPIWILVGIARCVQIATAGKSGIHPTRVRKAASPTDIVPQRLIDLGFTFDRDFKSTLEEWKRIAPEDFS
jgi:nucleoside-diphosphate-sugar epimerase